MTQAEIKNSNETAARVLAELLAEIDLIKELLDLADPIDLIEPFWLLFDAYILRMSLTDFRERLCLAFNADNPESRPEAGREGERV